MHSIFPQISEATLLAQQLGFESPAGEDLPDKYEYLKESIGMKGLSWIGKTLGSPMGLLPFLSLLYYSGMGRLDAYEAQATYETERLSPDAALRLLWKLYKGEGLPEELINDLRDQGWSEERIKLSIEDSKVVPPLADMVRFADYSSFDPEVIEKWREFYDAPDWIREPFKQIGLVGEWANLYWFSHWRQPGRFELGEMHRRGLIDDDAVKLAYRTMGYSPYWQDLLLDLVKAVPTRVDVRRFWDMRTIDEDRLREIYHARGYYGKDLEDYVLWTKVYVAFPDLISRYKNAWITAEEAKAELIGLGMPEDRAEEMWQTKFANVAAPERVEGTKQLTRALIIKGAKLEQIDKEQTLALLKGLNYGDFEAEFIYSIEVEAAASPEKPSDYIDMVNKYRRSVGMGVHELTEAAIEAEREWLQAKKRLTAAHAAGETEAEIRNLEALVEETKKRFEAALKEPEGEV